MNRKVSRKNLKYLSDGTIVIADSKVQQVTADAFPEIIPTVDPSVDLKRGSTLLPERRKIPKIISTDSYRPDAQRCQVIHQVDVFCPGRSEEHTSELQSLMRISYA